MLPIVINILLVIHVLVSLLIVLLTLMQRPKNEGLGAAFGGGMTENLFGAQTTNVLQTITRWLGVLFFGLTLLLSSLYVKQTRSRSLVQQKLSAPTVVPAPAATPAPAVDASKSGIPPEAPEATSLPVKSEGSTPPATQPASPPPESKPAEPTK